MPSPGPLAELALPYLAAIEAEMRHAVSEAPGAGERLGEYFAMLEYHLGWRDSGPAGKRLRPLLCLLCCAAADGNWQQALPVAAAIELIHNFSLIHDDIQDNSPLRRGRPTVWVQWGQAQAINAGDAMFTLANLAPHRLLDLGLPPEAVVEAVAELNRTCLSLTQGQHLDMAFESRPVVSVDEYLEMIAMKTGALIAAAARLGAQAALAETDRQEAYANYGRQLGLAFQLQDDLLGVWGDPAVTGKSDASDLEKRKKSLPVVYGLSRSAEFAERYANPHGATVADLRSELEALGARAYGKQLVAETTAAAHAALEACQPADPAGQALRELTQQLLHRHQ